jgi:hypothetical protein
MTKLEKLLAAVVKAEAEVLAELKRLYPIGCEVIVRIREGADINPSTVIGHIGGPEGKLRVRLSPNPRGTHEGRYASGYETTLPARKIIRKVMHATSHKRGVQK